MRTYRTLALVGKFIKIIGWITVIGTVLTACGFLVLGTLGGARFAGLGGLRFPTGAVVTQVIAAVVYVLSGLVLGALEVALGELVELFIDLSLSSQRSVQLLERLAYAPTASQSTPQPAAIAPPVPPQAGAYPAPGAHPPGYQR